MTLPLDELDTALRRQAPRLRTTPDPGLTAAILTRVASQPPPALRLARPWSRLPLAAACAAGIAVTILGLVTGTFVHLTPARPPGAGASPLARVSALDRSLEELPDLPLSQASQASPAPLAAPLIDELQALDADLRRGGQWLLLTVPPAIVTPPGLRHG